MQKILNYNNGLMIIYLIINSYKYTCKNSEILIKKCLTYIIDLQNDIPIIIEHR